MAFDTLTYARRLKQAGFSDEQAEALADATKDLILQDSATKADIAEIKGEIAALRGEMTGEIAALRGEMTAEITAVTAGIAAVRSEMTALEHRFTAALDTMGLRITLRMGALVAAGVATLAALIKL